jgi:hypothetical protein
MVRSRTKIGLLNNDKRILERNSVGSRQRGRPRMRWLNEVCNDLGGGRM